MPHGDIHPHPHHRYLRFVYDMFSSLCVFTTPVNLLNGILSMLWTDPKAHAHLAATFRHNGATASEGEDAGGEDADHSRSAWLLAVEGCSYGMRMVFSW